MAQANTGLIAHAVLAALAFVALASAATAQQQSTTYDSSVAIEKAQLARKMWSAFVCVGYAEMSEKAQEAERLYDLESTRAVSS